MNSRPLFKTLALAALLFGAATGGIHARTITWGDAVGDTLLYSTGGNLGNDVIFELGSFGSFTPTTSNMDQWAANWKIFDQAQAPSTSGFNSSEGFFSSTATVNADGTSSASPPLSPFVFGQGEQAYIWVFKADKGLSLTGGGEWALVTNDSTDGNAFDDWLFPSHSDQTNQPLDWRLSIATDVIFGGLNDVQGAGDHNSNPVTFDLQLHALVPEPGSAVLLGVAVASLGLRRRRNAA